MMPRLDFAPLDGITKVVFRRVWHRHFGGADRYFIPFFSPTDQHILTQRDRRELDPEANGGLPLVPQVMTRRAPDFLWAAELVEQMGYQEVNLNLGCPSGTVTATGKGSGFLARPEELERFFDEVFASVKLPVSVKTRLGVKEPEEFERLLEIYNRYPIACLTIHPRIQKQFYKGTVHRDWFTWAAERSRNPLCYNGDLVTVEDCGAFAADFPAVGAVMIGRGAIAEAPWRHPRHPAGDPGFHPDAVPVLPGLLRSGGPGGPADEGGLVLPDPPVRGRRAPPQEDAPPPHTGGVRGGGGRHLPGAAPAGPRGGRVWIKKTRPENSVLRSCFCLFRRR